MGLTDHKPGNPPVPAPPDARYRDIENALSDLRAGRVEPGLAQLRQRVLSFGMRVCGHREDAEDTSQEVLLKALQQAAKFSSAKAFSVWLYTVAKNQCLMSRRRSRFAPAQHLPLDDLVPTRAELQALATAPEASPEQRLLRDENGEHVRDALAHLPPPYRLILVLHDMEGLGTDAIGKVMGLKRGTVRVRLHRARLALRQELARMELPSEKPAARKRQSRECRQMFAGLSDYLDQTLRTVMCKGLEAHMEGCVPCKAFLRDLRSAVERCRKFDPACDAVKKTQISQELLQRYQAALPPGVSSKP